MIRKRSLGTHISDALIYAFLAVLSFICLAPLIHVLMASVSEPLPLEANMGLLLRPLGFTLKGYQLAFNIPSIKTGYINTFIIVLCGTAANMIMTCFAAYVISQKNWWYAKFITILAMITMFFSGGLIPTYLLVNNNLHMGDSLFALIVPNVISVWNLVVLRTGFATIPDSLTESAKLDGANDFTILARIIVPLAKATLAVIVLYYAVGHWNAWFDAMIYIRTRNKYPLQLVLREVIILESSKTTTTGASQVLESLNASDLSIYKKLVRYTTIVMATIPVLCFYPFIQKYFTTGVMIGSLKG
jgi:putative aldouronate transport system permease protein